MTLQGEVTVPPAVSKTMDFQQVGVLTQKQLTNFEGMPDHFENLNLGGKKMFVLRNLSQALLLT